VRIWQRLVPEPDDMGPIKNELVRIVARKMGCFASCESTLRLVVRNAKQQKDVNEFIHFIRKLAVAFSRRHLRAGYAIGSFMSRTGSLRPD
jgi:hypothetical protein